jgi:hypothetical protein
MLKYIRCNIFYHDYFPFYPPIDKNDPKNAMF